jgi:hypothetical protein
VTQDRSDAKPEEREHLNLIGGGSVLRESGLGSIRNLDLEPKSIDIISLARQYSRQNNEIPIMTYNICWKMGMNHSHNR